LISPANKIAQKKPKAEPEGVLSKNLEKEKADRDRLDEKKNGIKLMKTFVLRDRSRDHANEIKRHY